MANKYLDYAGLQRLVDNLNRKYAPISAIIFKSSVDDVASLPSLSTVQPGWMYSIKVGGGTTDDFIEGAGHVIADGENVAAVELITGYAGIPSPSSIVDPKALGWYEIDGEPTEVTPVGTENPKTENWYEKDGDFYVPTEDETVDNEKTYYTDVVFVLSQDRIPQEGSFYYVATTVKKWDILGGVFDLENKYLEFGDSFPQGPANRMVDGRTFLYMGDTKKVYTYVAEPEGRPTENGYFEGTFTVASTTDVVNPSQVPLYVETAEGSGIYARTTDTTVVSGTVYYTGLFIASADVTVDPNKNYYTEATLYGKGGIYTYNATTGDWTEESSGSTDEFIPITNKEVDDLFI